MPSGGVRPNNSSILKIDGQPMYACTKLTLEISIHPAAPIVNLLALMYASHRSATAVASFPAT